VSVARALVGVVAAMALAVPACRRDAAGGVTAPPRTYAPADLEGLILRRAEAPGLTVPVQVGALDLDELWPSACCPVQQEAFSDAGFVAAAGALFERPGHSGDPIDTRSGYEVVSSEAALFATDTGASQAMASWIDYHRAPELDPLPARGLGETSAGFVGMPNAPAETVVLFFWRIGRLVLHLRASGGSILVGDVRALADRMDARAS
jgi:hypothetical protein